MDARRRMEAGVLIVCHDCRMPYEDLAAHLPETIGLVATDDPRLAVIVTKHLVSSGSRLKLMLLDLRTDDERTAVLCTQLRDAYAGLIAAITREGDDRRLLTALGVNTILEDEPVLIRAAVIALTRGGGSGPPGFPRRVASC